MTDYAISYANLNAIENGLRAISDDLGTLNDNLGVIDRSVDNVNSNVQIVYSQEYSSKLRTRLNIYSYDSLYFIYLLSSITYPNETHRFHDHGSK